VTLKLLLENTEEASVVDTPDTLMGATPLMLAAAAGHSACVRSTIFTYFLPVLGIRIRRIRMFFGLPDPDLLVRGADPAPDPSPFSYINVFSRLK
jgi:ankyrin repeat protein